MATKIHFSLTSYNFGAGWVIETPPENWQFPVLPLNQSRLLYNYITIQKKSSLPQIFLIDLF